MSDVEFYVNSLSKKQLAEAYVHLRSRLESLEEKSARLERLALLERCAEKWAKNCVEGSPLSPGGWCCWSCGVISLPTSPEKHAHDCDAAHILDLEMEAEK